MKKICSSAFLRLSLVFTLAILIETGHCVRTSNKDSEWDIFGSNHDLPTIQLRPLQDIRSVIREIDGDDSFLNSRNQRDTRTGSDDPNNIPPPWRHHIDFDELHPGEDQIAVETLVDDNIVPIPVDQNPPLPTVEKRTEIPPSSKSSRAHKHAMPTNVAVVDTAMPFSSYFNSRINLDNESPASIWSKLFGTSSLPWSQPWWKGSNVCIKREEEDGIIESEGITDADDELVQTGSSSEENDYDLPVFHMKLSSCEEKHEMHSCQTHIIGPNINKTIKTDYECCPGYLLDTQKQSCERGTLKSIADTLEEVGAKEFHRLITSVGLNVKLTNENLTLFVPTDDSIASFMQSHRDIESNEISISLDREAMRRRRNVLMRQDDGDEALDFYTSEQVHPVNVQRANHHLPETTFEGDWKRNTLVTYDQYSQNRDGHGRHRSGQTMNGVTYSHADNNENLQQLLLNHMIQGKLSTHDFVDEQILYSQKEGNDSVLRLNTWNVNGERVHTINCVRMVSVNHRCSNGIVHMVNGVVKLVTKTIADVITSHEDLTILKSLTSISGLLSSFRDRGEHFTLFAPTNAALQRLGQHMLSKLRNGDPCLKRILRNHILPITLCSSIVTRQGQVRNLNHELLTIERSSDDKLFVNNTQIITRDIVTANGIVYIIDAVLRTEQDIPVVTALERSGFTSFLDQLSRVGLKNDLDDLINITVFAPSNKAMESLPATVLANRTRLREILLYHIAVPETRACHFVHDQQLKTRLNNQFIRMNLNSRIFSMVGQGAGGTPSDVTAQCGILEHVNRPSCNGIIHTVDRVLIPSEMNLYETLKTQKDLTIFTRLLQESNLLETLRGGVSLTVFAPTDDAFYQLPKEKLEKILSDKEESLKVLKLYIVKENLCCAGISPSIWFLTKQVEALNGHHIPVYREPQGNVVFGNSRISVCDLTASNGVIHTINKLLDMTNLQNPGYARSCLLSEYPF